MDSTKALTLATSRIFNGHSLDCYVDETDKNIDDFWATREQIGQLLGYSNPKVAITKIHTRNSERLNKFSRQVQIANPTKKGGTKMTPPSGNVQTATVYNFKGLLEICRYSNQPKANAVMDFLWDIADEIRKTGAYALNGDMQKQLHKLEAENILLHEKVDAMLEQPDRKRSAFLKG